MQQPGRSNFCIKPVRSCYYQQSIISLSQRRTPSTPMKLSSSYRERYQPCDHFDDSPTNQQSMIKSNENHNANIIHRPLVDFPSRSTWNTPNPGKNDAYAHQPELPGVGQLKTIIMSKNNIAPKHHFSSLIQRLKLNSCRHHRLYSVHRVTVCLSICRSRNVSILGSASV